MIKKIAVFISFVFCTLAGISQTNEWTSTGLPGTGREIRALYHDTVDDVLYVAGVIVPHDDPNISHTWLCMWDGSSWDSLGVFSGPINTVIRYEDKIWVAGYFSTIDGQSFPRIATWDGSSWEQPFEMNLGLIHTFKILNGEFYMMGTFSKVGNDTIHSLAKLVDGSWQTVHEFTAEPGVPIVRDIAIYNGDFYVGGNFSYNDIRDITVYKDGNWQKVGEGFYGGFNDVVKMAVYKQELYVVGDIDKSAGNVGNGIQKWNGYGWSEVGESLQRVFGVNAGVMHTWEMIEYGGYLWVAGGCNYADSLPIPNSIARWDGEQWCALQDSTLINPGSAMSICFYHDTLFAGAGLNDTVHNGLAKFDGVYEPDSCGKIYPSTVGLNMPAHNYKMSIYPNPATNKVFVNISWKQPGTEVIILGMDGTTYLKTVIGNNNSSLELDVSHLATGVYVVRIIKPSGNGNAVSLFVKM